MPEVVRRFFQRVYAMAYKETLHVRRDPRTLWLAIGMPVMLIVLFGFGVSFDVDHIPVGLLDQDQTAASRKLVESLTASNELQIATHPRDQDEAERDMKRHEAWAVVVIPHGFEDGITRGEPQQIQLLVDGADAAIANQILTKADLLGRMAVLKFLPIKIDQPLTAVAANRFNPASVSAPFLVPGLTAWVLALASVLLTALSVAREWERGSMEQLFATPVGRLEIIVGKLLPYMGLGFIQTLLVLAAGAMIFGVPMRGLGIVFLAVLLFLAAMLGQGLLISVVTKNQMVATQVGTFSALLPSLLLSGFLFPIANLPVPLQWISAVIPGRWFVGLLRAVLLRGAGFEAVWVNLLGLLCFATLMVVVSTARFQRRLA